MAGKQGALSPKGTWEPAPFNTDSSSEMDGRFVEARSLRQRLGGLVSSLGGANNLSYQEMSLCRRAVHLERLIEKRESTLAHGGDVDLNGYLGSLNTLSSLYSKVGY